MSASDSELLNIDLALTPSEVAKIFGVDPRTVTQWAQTDKIPSFRTPGGHRRFRQSDIKAFFVQKENS